MKDTLSYLVYQLLKANQIHIDFDELDFQIASHPTYPSLHAITGVLDHFNIENIALDVPATTHTLKQLPHVFLAQIRKDFEEQFVVVVKSGNGYKLIFNSKEKKQISQSEFLLLFTGIILVADPDQSYIQHAKKTSNFTSVKRYLTVASIFLLIVLVIYINPKAEALFFLLLSITGTLVSISIIKHEQNEHTILGHTFCSKSTKINNCNTVLSSKGSVIFKGLRLSDMSLVYFTTLALVTLICISSPSNLFISKLISLVAFPITIYSIYYQWFKLKKWCFLCLSIVLIMWFQAALSVANFSTEFDTTSILIFFLVLTCSTLFWILGSSVFKNYKSLQQTKIEHFRFKKNFSLFSNQLGQSKIITTHIDHLNEIVLGNPNCALNILIITNPMCGPCKDVHNVIEHILKLHHASVKLTIRFNVNPENPDHSAIKITSRLLEIYDLQGHDKCLEAMHEIYNENNPYQWFKNWSVCSRPKTYLKVLATQYNWCISKGINFTPEILINGQAFPKLYNRSDLLFFIEDLNNAYQHQTLDIIQDSVQNQ